MGTSAVGTKSHGIKRVPQFGHIGKLNIIISGRRPPLYCILTKNKDTMNLDVCTL